MTELWASLAVTVLLIIVTGLKTSLWSGLSMLGWIWPLRSIRIFLEDLSGREKVLNKWHFIAVGAGGFATFALAGNNLSFTAFSLPFSMAAGGVGLFLTSESYKTRAPNRSSPFHNAAFFFIGLFFLRMITYPFWRLNESINGIGPYAQFLFIIGLAVTSLPSYLIFIKERDDEKMKRVIKERSDKFLGQAKYSELGMMAAGIAHEINNPLAVIQARTTQLLRMYRIPERQKELADGLQQILYTSERINRTIQGIREFVHTDEKSPAREITLKEIFDDVLAFCGQRMKNHGVNLRFYGVENFSVMGNKIQLEQVILNLLNNSFDAIEYLPDKWIEMSCYPRGQKVQIYFKDSGHGIPPEISKKMMEPFFSTKSIGKGTGLGLALAKGIVEKHGGSLHYVEDSEYTTFLLELPQSLNEQWNVSLH